MKHFGFLPRLLVVAGLLVGLGAPITSVLTNTAEAAPQAAPVAQDGWWPGQASGGGSSGAGGWEEEMLEMVFYPDPVAIEGVQVNGIFFLPAPGVPLSLGRATVQASSGEIWTIEQVTASPRFARGQGGRLIGQTVWGNGRIEGRSVAEFSAAAQAAATQAQANVNAVREAIRNSVIWR